MTGRNDTDKGLVAIKLKFWGPHDGRTLFALLFAKAVLYFCYQIKPLDWLLEQIKDISGKMGIEIKFVV
jgi:hypothetical protein